MTSLLLFVSGAIIGAVLLAIAVAVGIAHVLQYQLQGGDVIDVRVPA